MCSKLLKVLCAAVLLFAVALISASCGNDVALLKFSSDTYVVEAGQKVDIDELRKMFLTEAADTSDKAEPVAAADTSATDLTDDSIRSETETAAADEASETVYWVAGGEVWHTKSTCSSLSRSKSVLSGTVDDAIEAGKDRVCKRCGG